jgi:truncated hemoglobin YjbI
MHRVAPVRRVLTGILPWTGLDLMPPIRLDERKDDSDAAERSPSPRPVALARVGPASHNTREDPVSGGRDLVGWAVLAAFVIGWGIVLLVRVRHRRRPRTSARAQITLPRQPPRPGDAAEHDLTALRHHRGDLPIATEAALPPVRMPDLFPGVPDTHLLTSCPTVDVPDGPMPLRDWLRHFAGPDAWSQVVLRFYARAAADPDIAGYFTRVDIDQLQRHFLAALMIVSGQGVTVGVVRRMHTAHAAVRNTTTGQPITDTTWNAVIGALAGVLGELGTPPATLVALATTLAPIRAAIVSEPGLPAR